MATCVVENAPVYVLRLSEEEARGVLYWLNRDMRTITDSAYDALEEALGG